MSKLTYAEDSDTLAHRILIRTLERACGRPYLERILVHSLDPGLDGFFARALQAAEVTPVWQGMDPAMLPTAGPLVIVANHPYGLVDGLMLCDLAQRLRGDFRILINQALCREPRLDPYMLPVDFAGTREAAKTNLHSRDRAREWLSAGGLLLVFPSGAISTAQGFFGPVVDPDWKLLPARLIQQSRATVVPIHFQGRNSHLFQTVSQVSVTLRMSLVIREAARLRGRSVFATIGTPISPEFIQSIGDRRQLMDTLRLEVARLVSLPPRKSYVKGLVRHLRERAS